VDLESRHKKCEPQNVDSIDMLNQGCRLRITFARRSTWSEQYPSHGFVFSYSGDEANHLAKTREKLVEDFRLSRLQPFSFSLCSDYSSPTHIPTGRGAAGVRALTTACLFHPPKKTFFVWDVSNSGFRPRKRMLPSAGPARKRTSPQVCPTAG